MFGYGYWGERWGKRIVMDFGMGMYITSIFKMDNQQGPIE